MPSGAGPGAGDASIPTAMAPAADAEADAEDVDGESRRPQPGIKANVRTSDRTNAGASVAGREIADTTSSLY